MNVLVVGDDPTGNKLLAASLELKGYTILMAEDGMKAISFLDRSAQIDLIISDINMPLANGYTFLTAVRKNPHYWNTPFIMYSACFIDNSHEALALDLGANQYIRKSGHTHQIMQAVEELAPAEILKIHSQ